MRDEAATEPTLAPHATTATNGHQADQDELIETRELAVVTQESGDDGDGGGSDIVIFCHPRNVAHLLAAWRRQIAHAHATSAGTGELPLQVVWSGRSGLLGQGVIVLSWPGSVPAWFRQQLSIDHEIFDFVIYEYGWVERDHAEAEPHTGELTPGARENLSSWE